MTIYKPKNTGYPENVIMIKYHLAIISYKDKKSQYDINLEVKLVLPKTDPPNPSNQNVIIYH